MAPRKRKVEGEEEAINKPDATMTTTRVTRSLTLRANVNSVEPPKKKGKAAEKQEKKKVNPRETEAEKEEAASIDGPKKTIVIEHCKQCNSFKTRAIQVKSGLENAVPGITVLVNPDKVNVLFSADFVSKERAGKPRLFSALPRRGCFEIREEGGEKFISLLDMTRPFRPMKALDMEKVISDIIDKIK